VRVGYIESLVFFLGLTPASVLIFRAFVGNLGANPIEVITHETGIWTLRILLVTLALTPIRRLTGWNVLSRFRRMLGLFAFFYASLHFLTYIVLDQFFAFDYIIEDIVERPYITVGFLGFVLLIPLAVTSSQAMIRRLGGHRWKVLHRLIYFCATAGGVHFLWQAKIDLRRPLVYAIVLAVLLMARLVFDYWRPVSVTSLRDQS